MLLEGGAAGAHEGGTQNAVVAFCGTFYFAWLFVPISPSFFFCSAAFIFFIFAFCLRGGISVVIRNFNQERRCPPRHLPPDAALTLHLTWLRRRGKHCNYVEHKRAARARWAMIKKQGVGNPTHLAKATAIFTNQLFVLWHWGIQQRDCDGLCWWPPSLSKRLINICQATWWPDDK